MSLTGEYEPSSWDWVRDQVELYERTGGAEGNTLRDTGLPIIIVTTRGSTTGTLRKLGLTGVEHDGECALVASKGGSPEQPGWYHNVQADPTAVMLQDGPEPFDLDVRELPEGPERDEWWARSVAAYPPYADYQEKTDRLIPVLIATRRA